MAKKPAAAGTGSGTRRTKAFPGVLPRRSDGATKRARPVQVTRDPLPDTPAARVARERIAEYADLILSTGRTVPVLSRGKPVALLGPVGSLPHGQQSTRTILISEIAKGTRNFTAVVHHGPFTVSRGGEAVMVLYSPTRSLASMVEGLIDTLHELRVLDEAIGKRRETRRRADDAIRKRIALLYQVGESASASKIEVEFRELERTL